VERKNEMIDAMLTEIDLQRNYLESNELTSIYFGGGTPSLLNLSQLQQLFSGVDKIFKRSNCEITLEANPDDLTAARLEEIKTAGINRLSIGIQSFDNNILKFLNRAHTGQLATSSLEAVRKAGFKNISVDLIYAIPGQSDEVLIDNIEKALACSPEHISAYGLTIESKTVFGNWAAKKKLIEVDEKTNARQYELLINKLTGNGYVHYEISNFCKSDLYSKHNSSYWKQEQYLGIGPSAHSYDKASRQFNVSNNSKYIKAINNGEVPFDKEVLTRENKINEYIFTTLRTIWGCDLEKLKTDYHFDLLNKFEGYFSGLSQKELIVIDKNILRLTTKGKLLADQISVDLML
jgi:oxygen-independent coproporphyrinogen-3 oxidase